MSQLATLSRWTGHAAAAKKGGETGPLGGGPSASLTSPKFEKESAARKELLEEHGLGGNALRKGIEACSNQGLTPGAVCALLLSLYVGRTVDESEVPGRVEAALSGRGNGSHSGSPARPKSPGQERAP